MPAGGVLPKVPPRLPAGPSQLAPPTFGRQVLLRAGCIVVVAHEALSHGAAHIQQQHQVEARAAEVGGLQACRQRLAGRQAAQLGGAASRLAVVDGSILKVRRQVLPQG